MIERAVVVCRQGPACEGDSHGWDCPLSDPLGDVLLALMNPLPNPVLDFERRWLLEVYLGRDPI